MMAARIQDPEARMPAWSAKAWVLLAVAVELSAGALVAAMPLAELDARFSPREAPVTMVYDVGYRLMNMELSHVGRVVASTTIGTWRHRVSGQEIPALFLDMRIDSPDSGEPGHRNRISIHDRVVAVMSLPDMQALVFAKHTDEVLRPVFRASVALADSVYDTQSGNLEYRLHDFSRGLVSTNLANAEALLELSRRIRPIMEYLVAQDKAPMPEKAELSDRSRIVANLDGRVAALRILAERDTSPVCLARQRLDSLYIRTVPERGSAVKPRDFHAWSMTFEKLSRTLKDQALVESARKAPVETVVPMAVEYELGLGCVRATLVSIRLAKGDGPERPLVLAKGPPAVGQE